MSLILHLAFEEEPAAPVVTTGGFQAIVTVEATSDAQAAVTVDPEFTATFTIE